ncbi:protein-methionine sulfoxide oxidase mical2b isoform X1 [Kryptolebias marmoratus]|uniref:protein-methionine sulfoxide oxidase mical2b isoform X1 n=1 Tax=Kryptolebias marmoratus TaxID=37003 RepID=UPI000D52F846|nr:protein-methionine sulfoxide oxidase mical2b isoform X1 [Kryptolebias marmoratus]
MSAVKALQQWCRVQCEGYRDVSITNMTTSFRDGLAFCALIHKHRPELIDFDSLKKDDVYENNKLAFKVAEDLGIPALLDAEDMVALKVPDRLSILTYVSQYYNYFHGRSPIGGMGGIKRPAEATANEPPGKKNQPVVSKVFGASKPARENSPPPSSNVTRPSSSSKPIRNSAQDVAKPSQAGTLSNKCTSCNQHVHLVQRHLVDGKLYHRSCAKSLPTNASSLLRDLTTNAYVSKFSPQPEPSKAHTVAPAPTPSELGPAWLTKKLGTPSNGSTAFSTSQPSSGPSSADKENRTTYVSKPAASRDTTFTSSGSNAFSTSPSSRPSSGASSAAKERPTAFGSKPTASNDAKFTTKASNAFSTSPSPQPSSRFASAVKESPTASVPKTTTSHDTTFTTKGSKAFSTSPSSQLSSGPSPAANTVTPAHTPSKLGLSWLTKKPGSPSNGSTAFPASSDTSSSAAKESPTSFLSKPTASHDTTFSTTITISPAPTASPQTSVAAAKTRESKLKFLQPDSTSNHEEKKTMTTTTTFSTDVNKGQAVTGKKQEVTPGQPVTVVINVKGADTGGVAAKTTAVGGRVNTKQENFDSNKTKASAAAFISKKLAEENNNNDSKPEWTTVALKKTEKSQALVETPKKETKGVRGRLRLKADPTILADLELQEPRKSSRSPVGLRGPADKGANINKASPNTTVSENESPSDWRSMLKPVSKETKPVSPSQPSPKPLTNGATKTPELPVRPSASSSHVSNSKIFVATPLSQGSQNVQKKPVMNGTKAESKTSKTKPDYIPTEEIIKELQEIENNLNELEKTGVELEMKLRRSEEEGEDDSVMDELMIEWFNLIRNKQVAMRRESELVYIGKTQELEEEQPSVEEELRRLMEKPEHLKTAWDKRKEEQLMEKLLEIVNGRNAIIDGLDEDRLREEEEDEQLNKMMKSFSFKKDKSKKKSTKFKLFSWGSKKEE